MAKKDEKYHFHMIAGTLITLVGEGPDVAATPANAIVKTTDNPKYVNAKFLGKAQENLQRGLMEKTPEEVRQHMRVIDVVITNIVYLGYMTNGQFLGEEPVIAKELSTPVKGLL